MVKVLVIGASGFVGQEVALELRRRGHEVWGLVRDPAKAQALRIGEVQVVKGDADQKASYEELVKKVDVIINAAQDLSRGTALDQTIFDNVTAALENAGGEKKLFISTSGGLVYENSTEPLTEDSPLSKLPFVQARVKVEQEVTSSKVVHGVVVRPPMIIGGRQGRWSVYFEQAEKEGKLSIYGTGENIIAFVHIQDLAEGYARIVEAKRDTVSGQFFHFAHPGRITLKEVALLFAEGAGVSNPKVETGLPWKLAFYDVNIWFDSSKAKRVLGWTPTHILPRDGKVLYESWKAQGIPAHW